MSGFNSDPGSSKSTNTQKTTNTDGRVTGGNDSSNLSINNASAPVTIQMTDAGAVHSSMQLALAGVEGANQTAQAAVASQSSLLDGAVNAIQAGQQQFTSAIEQIKTGDKTTKYVVAGAALVAVAFALHKKG